MGTTVSVGEMGVSSTPTGVGSGGRVSCGTGAGVGVGVGCMVGVETGTVAFAGPVGSGDTGGCWVGPAPERGTTWKQATKLKNAAISAMPSASPSGVAKRDSVR